MEPLRFIFSPSGRVGPQAFTLAAIGIYVAGVASQCLTSNGLIIRGGVWPFAIVQVMLIWIWFSLHAKRLRDADRSVGLAAAASALYLVAVLLLLFLLGTFFGDGSSRQAADSNSTGALSLILFIWIIAILSDAPGASFYWLGILICVMALVPIVFAVAVTLWAATRSGLEERTT
jgi:uncharacterized membrane protein YhaH (DUF805 family)